MTWTQLREMQAAGFEIGSHGVHHRMLAKLPQDDMEDEVRQSKTALERELGIGDGADVLSGRRRPGVRPTA